MSTKQYCGGEEEVRCVLRVRPRDEMRGGSLGKIAVEMGQEFL